MNLSILIESDLNDIYNLLNSNNIVSQYYLKNYNSWNKEKVYSLIQNNFKTHMFYKITHYKSNKILGLVGLINIYYFCYLNNQDYSNFIQILQNFINHKPVYNKIEKKNRLLFKIFIGNTTLNQMLLKNNNFKKIATKSSNEIEYNIFSIDYMKFTNNNNSNNQELILKPNTKNKSKIGKITNKHFLLSYLIKSNCISNQKIDKLFLKKVKNGIDTINIKIKF